MDSAEVVFQSVKENAQTYIESNELLMSYLKILFNANEVEKKHSDMVCDLTIKVGYKLGYSTTELEQVAIASIIHDIGKIFIAPTFLYKAGSLSNLERYVVKQHVILGSYLLLDIGVDPRIVDMVITHHEKINGRGYPKGIGFEKISTSSQLLTVIDIYDALVSERCYKKILKASDALLILRGDVGLNQDIVSELFRFIN